MKQLERIAIADSMSAIAADGIALFTCPRRDGNLRIQPKTCAQNYRMRAKCPEDSERWIRLWECKGCPVGEFNSASNAS